MSSDEKRMAQHEIWCHVHNKRFVVYTTKGHVVVYEHGCLCVKGTEKKA